MTSVIETANAQQRAASAPRVSAFVAASAGSGKTKLLTDRLLRLMLSGTAPDKILCLTYTKAAAAEMVLRLNRRLGNWVMLPEDRLVLELRALDVPVNAKSLALARKLFADVLDLPGGMRIGTIHAFCQSLLRRFPLEAGLSPHFEVADDEAQFSRLREARETVLANPSQRAAIFALAAETDEQCFADLTADLAGYSGNVAATPENIRAALGAGDESYKALLDAAVTWPREQHVAAVLRRIAEAGNISGQNWANEALDWLAKHPKDRTAAWEDWLCAHFTKNGLGPARTLKGFYGKQLAGEEDAIKFEISKECERIEKLHEQMKAAKLAALNLHLAALTAPILQSEYEDKKLTAQLSYSDLVNLTGKLLIDPGAAWVLYKMDGGIDHLLLDEVQDTAPAQWEIANAIADEFFSGANAREVPRSIFAVGDAKQSIFSFQGADLASFEHYRGKLREKTRGAGEAWLDGELSVSFRSTAPVLALVDAVFAQGLAREGVCAPGEALAHGVSRAGQAGAVTLWPLTRQTEPDALPAWAVPEKYEHAASAKAILARQIALDIRARLDAGEMLQSRGRAATAGDFLILVRRRDALVNALTSACKALKIPVAGLDRMVLTEQQAVSDLLALCDALLLPEDELAFAQYLASPLGGLEDESMMALALDRGGKSLVAALYARAQEREDWRQAREFFEALRARVDFLTPFALLSEALHVLGGRAKMLARLGAEASEPIEELLAEALNFAQGEPGALQVFVHQLRQSGASIKREAETGGDVLRIMTVHGAKGLQAPIVILPDTTALPEPRQSLFWLPMPEQPGVAVPIFCPRSALRPAAVAAAAARDAAAQREEYNRLLYVALTRAEDELIICGAEGKREIPEASWYTLIKSGFERLGHERDEAGVLRYRSVQTAAPDRLSQREAAILPTLPLWAGSAPGWAAVPPEMETTRPERIAPSRSVEDETKRAIAASPLGNELAELRGARAAAMAKGRAIHALLQHLPEVPAVERKAAAMRYLASITELAGQEADVCASVLAILDDSALAVLFGPGSHAEIPLAGVVGDVEIGGLVDRLAVTATEVFIADYKTDRQPPAAPGAIPADYLRQLAAYKAILAQIYPEREIHCLLVWTASATVMPVPPGLIAPQITAMLRSVF